MDIKKVGKTDGHVSRNVRVSLGLVKMSGFNIFIDSVEFKSGSSGVTSYLSKA
jgi:hypothetical protein